MKQLNPTIKFLGTLVIGLVVSFQNNLTLNLLLISIFSLISLFHIGIVKWIKLSLFLSLTAIGIFFTGYFFIQEKGNTVIFNTFIIQNQVIYGVQLASRIYCFGYLGASFTATTEIVDLVYSLQQQIKLPANFAYGIMTAFNIFPLIQKEYSNTKISLLSRGIRVSPISPTLLTPVLVKSIRWSELLAIALESKGFNGEADRTHSKSYQVTFLDILYLVTLFVLILLGYFFNQLL